MIINVENDEVQFIKLIDFDMAKKLGARKNNELFEGTDGFVDPSLLANNNIIKNIKCDIYSMGFVIFEAFEYIDNIFSKSFKQKLRDY